MAWEAEGESYYYDYSGDGILDTKVEIQKSNDNQRYGGSSYRAWSTKVADGGAQGLHKEWKGQQGDQLIESMKTFVQQKHGSSTSEEGAQPGGSVQDYSVTSSMESTGGTGDAEGVGDVAGGGGVEEGGGNVWGAASISKDDFVDPSTGQQRTLQDVYNLLAPKLPGIKGDALRDQIKDMAPKYTEEYGMAEEKGFAKEAYEQDVYGLQKGARQIGGAMRGAAGGGSGAGMRAGIGAAGELGTQFAQAGQAYGKSMYDIEQAGTEKYEADVTKWLDPSWFKTQAKEGGYVKRDGSGISNDLEETFLDALTKLPDAGGS